MAETLTNEEIAQKLADLQAANDKLAQDNKTISAENQKLMKAFATDLPAGDTVLRKAEPKLPTQRVRVGEADYAFQVPTFYHGGFYRTAEELAADYKSESAQTILADIIKIDGQGILKEVK